MALLEANRPPRSTYRIQLHAQFTFADLERLIPYLRELGISDCYCSPILFSAPGSTHGYDVNDYRKIDPELGGRPALDSLSKTLQQEKMGLVLDFVPNHMGINGPFNPWWQDVLENGPHSPHARFFDVHWNSHQVPRPERILVPILGDHYGVVLEEGQLSIAYDGGLLKVKYFETQFPLNARAYEKIVGRLSIDLSCAEELRAPLRELALSFAKTAERMSRPPIGEAIASKPFAESKKKLSEVYAEDPRVSVMLDATLGSLNGKVGEPRSFDALDEILEEQHYRLARWKTGAHEINYRRFFAVDTLVGLRMEKEEVFRESHALVGTLVGEGKVTGLRIDHIDGLWDPQQYLDRLQTLRPKDDPNPERPLYVVVEKILASSEEMPATWPVHGTTGYEFIFQLSQLLTDRAAESRFDQIYEEFVGPVSDFEDLLYEKKRLVLEEMFANVVNNLAFTLATLVEEDRRWRDLTRHELIVAVREIMAGMAVYRTYRRGDEPANPGDRCAITEASARAMARNPQQGTQPFEFVRDLLVGDYPPAAAQPAFRAKLTHWVITFQQYTGAVMAKAAEDTAFYIYNRLIALNEVGGEPASFGRTTDTFHRVNQVRLEKLPLSLLATSTHDTKLSEDVRARLYALSEIPEEWQQWVREWHDLNRSRKIIVDAQAAPDANEEYRLYQTLLGVWPLDLEIPDDFFRERLREHLRKAVNEAKTHTNWINPNDAWIQACDHFLDTILALPSGQAFLDSFRPKAARLAHLGMVNSLIQVVLKLTSPGVPDLYQGNEIWDFSLVDPDNRRPVDYRQRENLLGQIANRTPRELLRQWKDGGIKLRATQTLLRLREQFPEMFAHGTYEPLAPSGRFSQNVVAFRRSYKDTTMIVATPRLTAKLGCPPLGLVWEDTAISLSGESRAFKDVFTGRDFLGDAPLSVAELFDELPFAVLKD